MAPALGPVFGIIAKLQKCVHMGVASQDDVASAPAVAAAGSSARHEFLASKCHAAVSASASGYVNFGLINEHNNNREIDRYGDQLNGKSVEREDGWSGEQVG